MKFKKVIISILPICLMLILTACGCEHEWQEATCTNPKTCALCGDTEGEVIEHEWTEATCISPKTCSICGKTEGGYGEHDFADADCTNPKTCKICGAVEGAALGHNYVDGYCTHCYMKDPDFFDAENYGFINNYGMYTWVQISSYSIGKENANATFTEQGWAHIIYKFKDGTLYSYSRFETDEDGDVDNKNLTQKLVHTSSYTIKNNNSIYIDGETWTIFDRICDNDGNLIIKVMINSKEYWFILEEQIDWEKSPKVEDHEGRYTKDYTYYFQ